MQTSIIALSLLAIAQAFKNGTNSTVVGGKNVTAGAHHNNTHGKGNKTGSHKNSPSNAGSVLSLGVAAGAVGIAGLLL